MDQRLLERPAPTAAFFEPFALTPAMRARPEILAATSRVLAGHVVLGKSVYRNGDIRIALRRADADPTELGSLVVRPEDARERSMHTLETVNKVSPGLRPEIPGIGSLVMLGMLAEFSRDDATRIEWIESLEAEGFYAKFFEKFGACLDGLGMAVAHDADSGRRSVSKRR